MEKLFTNEDLTGNHPSDVIVKFFDGKKETFSNVHKILSTDDLLCIVHRNGMDYFRFKYIYGWHVERRTNDGSCVGPGKAEDDYGYANNLIEYCEGKDCCENCIFSYNCGLYCHIRDITGLTPTEWK